MSELLVKEISSERVVFPNVDGKKIVANVDCRPDCQDAPVIVVTPKYGETKKNNLQLGYFLAANGFRVVRFDFTNHFGESDGDMLKFTLGQGVQNIRSTLDYIERTFGRDKVTLLASSLSSLMAVRAAAEDDRVVHLVSLVGVVNLQYTLIQVYQDDLVGGFMNGRRYGVLDILGHEVEMDQFFDATIQEKFYRLEDVARDVSRINAPISWFPAVNDVWVRMEDVEAIAKSNGQMSIYPIEGAMHEIRENQAAAEMSMKMVVSACRARYFSDGLHVDDVLSPSKRTLMTQNRIERTQLRRAAPAEKPEQEFWNLYLNKYRVMEKMEDFQQYLDLVGDLLGPISSKEILLDAGCGNGLFGAWVTREMIRNKLAFGGSPPVYFGLDLTEGGLADAQGKHLAVQSMLRTDSGDNGFNLNLLYARADVENFGDPETPEGRLLQFSDGCFDKIVCSLLLSYLQKPDKLLKHLHRVLRSRGRIVISSMKPFCDLSAIYRDFVHQDAAQSDVESARELLRAAGAIKVKEEQGYYTFFSDEQLVSMLTQAGFQGVQCFASLGNQAFVAVGTK